MRSQKIALSLIIVFSSVGFAANKTLLTKESATTIDLKMDHVSFEKGIVVKNLGKFKVNNKEISCRIGDRRAETSKFSLESKDLRRVGLVSHIPALGSVHFEITGSDPDNLVQMMCSYQALVGGRGTMGPLSVEDIQGYFNKRESQQIMLRQGIAALLGSMSQFLTFKTMKRIMPANTPQEILTENSNPQACPDPNRQQKLSDQILQRCTPDHAPQTLIFQGHVTADGSNPPINER